MQKKNGSFIGAFLLSSTCCFAQNSVHSNKTATPQDSSAVSTNTEIENVILTGRLFPNGEAMDPRKVDQTVEGVFQSDFSKCSIPKLWLDESYTSKLDYEKKRQLEDLVRSLAEFNLTLKDAKEQIKLDIKEIDRTVNTPPVYGDPNTPPMDAVNDALQSAIFAKNYKPNYPKPISNKVAIELNKYLRMDSSYDRNWFTNSGFRSPRTLYGKQIYPDSWGVKGAHASGKTSEYGNYVDTIKNGKHDRDWAYRDGRGAVVFNAGEIMEHSGRASKYLLEKGVAQEGNRSMLAGAATTAAFIGITIICPPCGLATGIKLTAASTLTGAAIFAIGSKAAKAGFEAAVKGATKEVQNKIHDTVKSSLSDMEKFERSGGGFRNGIENLFEKIDFSDMPNESNPNNKDAREKLRELNQVMEVTKGNFVGLQENLFPPSELLEQGVRAPDNFSTIAYDAKRIKINTRNMSEQLNSFLQTKKNICDREMAEYWNESREEGTFAYSNVDEVLAKTIVKSAECIASNLAARSQRVSWYATTAALTSKACLQLKNRAQTLGIQPEGKSE